MSTALFECQNLKCPDSFIEKSLECQSLKLPPCLNCQESLVLVPEKSSIGIKSTDTGRNSNFIH